MAKIKYGVDPGVLTRVGRDEMKKVLGYEPETQNVPLGQGTLIGHVGGYWITPNFAGLKIDRDKGTVEVANDNDRAFEHPNTNAAAKIALQKLKEYDLIE